MVKVPQFQPHGAVTAPDIPAPRDVAMTALSAGTRAAQFGRQWQGLSLFRLLFSLWLGVLSACGGTTDLGPAGTFSVVLDAQTHAILEQLQTEGLVSPTVGFSRNFIGIYVPENFLPYEPFVLGFATESAIPTVLLLDAATVRRYAASNWLTPLDSTGIYPAEGLVPGVARAFSLPKTSPTGERVNELVGVPNSIRGNILFYRQDLLQAYQKTPPRTWEELKAICRDILPREQSLNYGLIFALTDFIDAFYPIFWGFGGKTHDAQGRLIFLQPEMLGRAEAALAEIVGMLGTLAPAPGALKRFAAPSSLSQAFFQGEALFMIDWNTRLHDLRLRLDSSQAAGQAAIKSLEQVGVGPIPCQSGGTGRYSNLGSSGWAVNRFAVTLPGVKEVASQFLHLVNSERVQLLRAENAGEVPTLANALSQVKNPGVLRIYENVFGSLEVILQSRPQNRKFNDILAKHLQEALLGRQTPAQAIQAAAAELKNHGPLD